jgi:spore coat protein YutH
VTVDILKEYFDLKSERAFMDGNYSRYIRKDKIYTLVAVTDVKEEMLVELYEMSEHLASQGDRYVSTFYPSKDKKFLVTHEDVDFVLLENKIIEAPKSAKDGRKLARFHVRGRSISNQIKEATSIGQWKKYWETRLEQMEMVWVQKMQEQSDVEFHKVFVESFPYYLGLCENAIQYLVDTELDEEPLENDSGTICHERFYKGAWGKEIWIRNPFEWVFDHSSRDVAEWIRDQYFKYKRTFQPEIQGFLRDYQSVTPLSPFSIRLIYARLLFPLHYFTCVEEYFIVGSESSRFQLEDQIHGIVRHAKDYEVFLKSFYEMAEVPARRLNIPEIEWLGRP